MSALMPLENSVFVVHSPQGCIGCASMSNDLYHVGQAHRGVSPIRNARIIVTNLDKRDVILGGEEKLREAIRLANNRYHPKLIFIFTSCASGIIGDDIDAVAAAVQNEITPIVVPIHCNGFKSKVCASGFETAFISVAKYILRGEKLPKEKGLINLFAPTSVSYKDQIEMERMLGVIGLHVNYIPFYSSLEKIQKIPAAVASTAICKVFADEFMKGLEETYDIPFSHTVMPIGVRNTDKWFRGIAALVSKKEEAERYIEKEHQRVMPEIQRIREPLQGESYLGYEIAFQAFLNSIVKPAEKQKSLVNLFGFMPYHDPFWEGNFEEITRILEKLGLSVNTFFTRHQGIEAIRCLIRSSI